jgi:murein DD-endopeptidase MepM/ murein hydrolase activator NlpD
MTDRKRVLTIITLSIALLSTLVWRLTRTTPNRRVVVTTSAIPAASLTDGLKPAPTPSIGESASPEPSPSMSAPPLPSPTSASTPVYIPSTRLLIPVEGVKPEQLVDTYTAARSEGRVHDAIDIPAPQNTPVLAAADGTIVKLFQSKPGGTTIYQLDPDNKTIYYYAHLDHYADGIVEGRFVHQGDTIAYVGDTGNAGPGNYHLHFSIAIVADPKRYWDGVNINPYPLLTGK